MAVGTPEGARPSGLSDIHREALERISDWLLENATGSSELTRAELSTSGFEPFDSGWRLPSAGGGTLLLLFDSAFPYSLPRIALEGRVEALAWPHVERTGLLCLVPTDSPVSTLDPVGVVASCLSDARRLLVDHRSSRNIEDFKIDIEAYWRRTIETDKAEIYTLVTHAPPSRLVKAWHGENFYFVANTQEETLRWMQHRYGLDKSRTVKDAGLIWLDDLPTPDLYPENISQLRQFVRSASKDGMPIIDNLLSGEPDRVAVMMMGQTPEGRVGSIAVELLKPRAQAGEGRHVRAPATKGFRPGHVPMAVLAVRYAMRRMEITRVDAARSRMSPDVGEALENKMVAIIGCGSLGSTAARLLLQSGVGKLLLVDPDHLSWANIGRHELGADQVTQGKAAALAKHFMSRFPHVKEIQVESENWISAFRKKPDLFTECDLIVSTTGSWNAESALCDVQRAGWIKCPVVYGWMEERAAAAHALATGPSGSCFRCGFGPTGRARVPVAIWPEGSEIAQCGAATSVYGAVELGHAQSLVAELAIDVVLDRVAVPVRRVWIAQAALLHASKGMWNPDWTKVHGDPGYGGLMTGTDWPMNLECNCHLDFERWFVINSIALAERWNLRTVSWTISHDIGR